MNYLSCVRIIGIPYIHEDFSVLTTELEKEFLEVWLHESFENDVLCAAFYKAYVSIEDMSELDSDWES